MNLCFKSKNAKRLSRASISVRVPKLTFCAYLLFVCGLGLPCNALADGIKEYLAIRKKLAIKQPASLEALDVFVGIKTLEIRGLVKGSFEVDEQHSILIERTDREPQIIDCDSPPNWIGTGEIRARLIVTATRPSETDPISVRLVAIAPEESVAKYDIVPKPASKKPTQKATASRGGTSSRPISRPIISGGTSTIRGVSDWLVQQYASFVKGQNRRLADRECLKIANLVLGYSVRYGVDPRLIMAILFCESGFNPSSTSRSGAMGLGQLMPETARELGVFNAYDNNQNLYGTVKLMRGHLEKYSRTGSDFRQLALALAAYNAGPGAVKRHGGIPPYRETQRYVQKVIAVYRQLCRND